VLPHCIDPKSKTTRKCTERETEQYYADRSALKAQWEASNKAHWGFYVGLSGIVLLFWTLYETFAAGKELRRQTENSLLANELEYKPYIKASNIILHTNLMELTVHKSGKVIVTGKIFLENYGKTPMFIREVIGRMTIHLRGIECAPIVKPRTSSIQGDEVIPNDKESITVFLSFDIPEDIKVKKFEFDDLIFDITTTVKYDDMFSINQKAYKYLSMDHWGTIEYRQDPTTSEDALIPSIEFQRIRSTLRRDYVHESKYPENLPKQKGFNDFLKETSKHQEAPDV